MNRRAMLLGPLAFFSIYALLREVRTAGAEIDGRLSAKKWIARQNDLARGLRKGSISQIAWHDEMARLAREVDVAQLMAEIKRSHLSDGGEPFMHDPKKRNVVLLDDAGQRLRVPYGAALFSFTPKNVITPHAHKHMASAHMVLEGKVRIRTFDRLADEEGALVIRPTADHVAGVGDAAAMTTARDNIHWFAPRSDTAMTFDVIVSHLDPGQQDFEIQPIDPRGAGASGWVNPRAASELRGVDAAVFCGPLNWSAAEVKPFRSQANFAVSTRSLPP